MKTIWKYEIPHYLRNTPFDKELPRGAQIISVQAQQGTLCFWALVDTEQPLVNRVFEVKGTGQSFDDDQLCWIYLGTALIPEEYLVWHLFVRPEEIEDDHQM